MKVTPEMADFPDWHGTTIVAVRKDGRVTIAGDGQVTMGQTVMKPNARKVRRLGPDGAVIGGFVMTLIGRTGVDGFNLPSFLVATGGAVLLLAVVKGFRKR